MSIIALDAPGKKVLLMGNEAIARGALEAGVKVCAAYPGNPSSEIIGSLSQVASQRGIYVEWSVNEKVALEVAAAASLAGLRGLAAMKQNGLNVASDFLFNLNLTGTKGGLVVVVCDDPSALSSSNEEDSRAFARIGDLPLLEPSTFQEAKEMTKWAFDLSEELGLPCLMRSVTRVSHARGNVELGELPSTERKAKFDTTRPIIPVPVAWTHRVLHEKLEKCRGFFEKSPFNRYDGPQSPELLIVASGACWMYAAEAVETLGLGGRVGIVKLATTWPLPEEFLVEHLKRSSTVLFVEEVDPFIEEGVKALAAQRGEDLGVKRFLGKATGTIPSVGEITPDILMGALKSILGVPYEPRPADYAKRAREAAGEAPSRTLGFCAGCPHRATYWAIKKALTLDGRDGFVLGDIGCYSLGMGPAGFFQMKTLHAMGSGAGLANGFGQLGRFGLEQPVVAVCGDSTFYHAAVPALVNGAYNRANFTLVLLDNSATAMTGFQPHPGTGRTAMGEEVPVVDMEGLCRALGVEVEVVDPFDIEGTVKKLSRFLEFEGGVRVLISKQECALVRARRPERERFKIRVDQDLCLGKECGCNRLCTRVFKCPGLVWDPSSGKAQVDEAICTGCGVCASICPQSAILKEAAPS
jgi:indolepyruvate ferredoxin oxidoreductase alpha subunit